MLLITSTQQLQTRMTLQTFNDSVVRRRAIQHGWRSGLEESLAADLQSKGIEYAYEQTTLHYIVPQRTARYTPDFYVTTRSGKVIVIESKGYFPTANRQLMILVKNEYPELDIRFVFSRSRQTISHKSKTTYGMWCQKHGFPFADRLVPEEWLDE